MSDYFYKNLLMTFVAIYDSFFNGFSNQIYWPFIIPQLYGLFFTIFFGPFTLGLDTDV